MPPTVKPKALRKGDTIGVVVPAGPLNRERIDRALARVRDRGFKVKTYGDIYRSRGYLAGDDATRAKELMAAFADSETSAVWCARGGYGVMRMLHLVDFNVIRDNPKVFVGFSDITALHIPIQKRTRLITFHGPNLQDGFGKPEDMSTANQTALWRMLAADQQSPIGSGYDYDFSQVADLSLRTICGGSAVGELTGGNLAMLSGTMGTPDEFDTAGRILFLEDVSERLYRIDRYLTQLRLAGKFDSVAGVLLGSFSYDADDQAENPNDVAAFVDEFFAPLNVPVLAGFPAGHDKFNLTLPMGGRIKMDADRQQTLHCWRIASRQFESFSVRSMNDFAKLIDNAADIFGWVLVPVILLSALYFTVRLRFVQFVRFGEAVRETIASRQVGANGALSPLQAFMTAIAATVGTGNIVGVATALISGGPGAMFWIWCYGLLAMATKFAEASLGMHFRVARGEMVLSGPMYYLRDGLKAPWLAAVFAVLGGFGVLLTTPLTQPNSIAVALASQLKTVNVSLGEISFLNYTIDRTQLAIGLVLAVLTWLVIVHGIKSIGRAAEKLSPVKVGFYMIGALVVIIMNIAKLPEVLAMVFHDAFLPHAATGAATGFAVRQAISFGIRRGVYANEAGYGTAAVTYGTAKSQRPDQQGLAAMMDVFIITFITCTLSGFAILLTGEWNTGKDGPAAIPAAFSSAMPVLGGWMVAISIFLFAYTVLIGWEYYGEQFFEYLFGPWIVKPFRWIYCLLIPFGAVIQVKAVWAWGDIFNGLQVFPNMIGLIGLSGIAATYAQRRFREPPPPA